MIEHFADPERGGFFTTANDHEELVARRKDVDDHPIPSGNSAAAYALLRLAALTGDAEYEREAVGVLRPPGPDRGSAPAPASRTSCGQSTSTSPPPGRSRWRAPPARTSGRSPAWSAPACARTWSWPAARRAPSGRSSWPAAPPSTGRPAAYVCERFACRRPVTEPAELGRPSRRRVVLSGQPLGSVAVSPASKKSAKQVATEYFQAVGDRTSTR